MRSMLPKPTAFCVDPLPRSISRLGRSFFLPLIDDCSPATYDDGQLSAWADGLVAWHENRGAKHSQKANRTNNILIDEQISLCPPSFLENCDIFERKSAFGQAPERGAVERCYFRSLSQGFQESSLGVLPVFFLGS